MSAVQLLAELRRLGLRIEANGEQLRFRPQAMVTPEVLGQLKANKTELLAALRHEEDAAEAQAEREAIQAVEREADERHSAQAIWRATLDELEGDTSFPIEVVDALRTADVRWSNE